LAAGAGVGALTSYVAFRLEPEYCDIGPEKWSGERSPRCAVRDSARHGSTKKSPIPKSAQKVRSEIHRHVSGSTASDFRRKVDIFRSDSGRNRVAYYIGLEIAVESGVKKPISWQSIISDFSSLGVHLMATKCPISRQKALKGCEKFVRPSIGQGRGVLVTRIGD
jgi:hypothetical protein